MEKIPDFRVVGGTVDDQKNEKEEMSDLFLRHNEALPQFAKDLMKEGELKKTEKEIELIGMANKLTSEAMEYFGLEHFSAPVENIHILNDDIYAKFHGNEQAFNYPYLLLIGVNESMRENAPFFADAIIHEQLHFKSHLALQVWHEEDKNKSRVFRSGLSVKSAKAGDESMGWHMHFTGLNEAVVAKMEKILMKKAYQEESLAKEGEWLATTEAKDIKKSIALKERVPEDEIIWIDKERNSARFYPYWRQRKVLDYVLSEINKQFPDKYRSVDDVFKEFARASFTGQLLPLGRLIEKTFGTGSFRILGSMTDDDDSPALCLESLKRARAKI